MPLRHFKLKKSKVKSQASSKEGMLSVTVPSSIHCQERPWGIISDFFLSKPISNLLENTIISTPIIGNLVYSFYFHSYQAGPHHLHLSFQ